MIIIVLLIYFDLFLRYSLENFNQTKIEIIVSRYNEDLEWLKDEPFNKYPTTIYNKGVNDDFFKPDNAKIVKLANVGRCDHTYLYHIVTNYDNNLSENTIFLPGSTNMPSKNEKAKKQVNEVESHNNTVFLAGKHNNIKTDLYNFTLDNWTASDSKNSSLNAESQLELSKIRPFGKWFENHFGSDLIVQYASMSGILGINKKHITLRPKSFYETLMAEVSNSSNPEVGHYLERAWNAVFFGDGIVYIDYF
jgi:hypothetical protein